jgi:hypothetical protein
MGVRRALSIKTSASITTSEHHVQLDPPLLEATADAATWLTGLIRFGVDEHVQHTCPHDDR